MRLRETSRRPDALDPKGRCRREKIVRASSGRTPTILDRVGPWSIRPQIRD
jgi:hypothetical protein